MHNEENDIDKTPVRLSSDDELAAAPLARLNDTDNDAITGISTESEATQSAADMSQADEISELEDDIIRNDTIPETSNDTPGSIGVFPVGAFDTSKD